MAVGDIPQEVVDRIRLGRLTALSQKTEKATAPFQCALSTKAGCECVAHIVQALTDQDVNATVVTVDGVGTFDLISRNAMLEGLLRMEEGDQLLPFVQCFYGTPSMYLWEDEMGNTQEIPQGDEGEQGDPLMPMLFSLGRAPGFGGNQAETSGSREAVCLP